MSHRESYGCCRCLTNDNLQYDNTLSDYMCKACWDLYFKAHDTCMECGEWVLLPRYERKWFSPTVERVASASLEFGYMKGDDRDSLICLDCKDNPVSS